jgi:thymidylate synthase
MYVMKDYDSALERILKEGVRKENRTGVDTIALFGIQSRYRIDEYFPFLTGRKLRFESMIGELIWFLSGSTNNEDLKNLGCKFWTPWVDEEFEKKHGFAPGSFGPVYGFQLRHFGGEYGNGIGGEKNTLNNCVTIIDVETDDADDHHYSMYGTGGFDQLAYMMDRLKNHPDCRRILFSLWNPQQMHQMRLPPCHYTFQCFVHDGKLSGELTQRSCDFPVGVPFNIAFYSAFIYMLAQQTGLEPYEFVHSTVDSHIYANQIEAVEEYLARSKPDSPKLELNKAEDIDLYKPEDFVLKDYEPQPTMKFEVAV